jgi:hypothetical protein
MRPRSNSGVTSRQRTLWTHQQLLLAFAPRDTLQSDSANLYRLKACVVAGAWMLLSSPQWCVARAGCGSIRECFFEEGESD